MPPDAAALNDALTMLAAFVIGTGIVVGMLPVGECSHCAHCANERKKRGPGTSCPLCRKQLAPGEPHSHEDTE